MWLGCTQLSIGHNLPPAMRDAQSLNRLLAPYRAPSNARGVVELAITALPFLFLFALAFVLHAYGYWWISLLVAIPAGGFMVRLFTIQHDCGHGAFFRNKLANDWVGRALGVFTLTPYDFWRNTHAIHHSSSGNLDRRGIGDVDTLTLAEYLSRTPWRRFLYRLYRHPLVLFVLGPIYLFGIQHRLPLGLMRNGWKPWISTQATNVAIAAAAAFLMWAGGVKAFLIIYPPIMFIAACAGVWLFYVQHQFEGTVWTDNESWTFHGAALQGSSFYDLPPVLRWFTANIGIHHIHHVSSRIPYYRLPRVLRDYPDLAKIGRITMVESLKCARLTLWDEQRQRLISFRDARRRAAEEA